jgi:chromosome segregation ATPase
MSDAVWDTLKEIIKYLITAGIGGLITIWVARWSKTRAERFASILETILKSTELSAEQYLQKMELVTKLDATVTAQNSKIRELDGSLTLMLQERASDRREIDSLITHRNERESRISALEGDVRVLHDQVLDWETKYNALRDKYNKAIEITVHALERAGIEVPEELVLLLGDSIRKFKLPKPK